LIVECRQGIIWLPRSTFKSLNVFCSDRQKVIEVAGCMCSLLTIAVVVRLFANKTLETKNVTGYRNMHQSL